MADGSHGSFVFYHYNPSGGAAGAFIALFSLSTIYHVYQLGRNRTWYFIPFLIGCIFELLGYVGRSMSAKETPDWTLGPYIMQSLLLLLGPTLLAASIYMVLGRLIRLVQGDAYSLIKPTRLTKVFVAGDVLSFLAQSGGGGMLAQAKSAADTSRGENIITAGLVLQIIFFGFFMVVTVIFHRRILAAPTPTSITIAVPWQRYIFVLYAASLLIMVRSVFRVAEYAGGSDGTLQSSEAYIYVFDATLMWIVAVLFNVFHPSAIISSNRGGMGKDAIPLSDTENDAYATNGIQYGGRGWGQV